MAEVWRGLRRRGLRAPARGQAHPAEHRGGRRVHRDVHRRGEDRRAAQHANIAQIFDLGKVDDSYFIALEYVTGPRFARHLRPGAQAPRSTCRSRWPATCVACRSARGSTTRTTSATRRGASCTSSTATSRRRTCSSRYEGEVKLIDFGIAKAAGKASKTQAGILKGKFGYMSPEQVRGLPIDRR